MLEKQHDMEGKRHWKSSSTLIGNLLARASVRGGNGGSVGNGMWVERAMAEGIRHETLRQ